jgi:hypothetical protein
MAYPYLPVNPCCTDVVLNTPCGCSSTITNTGCNTNLCGTNLTASSTIVYDGPALTCTTAEPCDTLNVILQKIDNIICNLLTQINTLTTQVTNINTQIVTINNSIISINNQLDGCCVTTTTTTTAHPCENFSLDNTGLEAVAIIITDCTTQNKEAIILAPGATNICVVTDSPLVVPGTVIVTPNGPCSPPTTSTTSTSSTSSTTTTTTTAIPCECLTFENTDTRTNTISYVNCLGDPVELVPILASEIINVCGCCGIASDALVTISVGANCIDGACPPTTTTTTTCSPSSTHPYSNQPIYATDTIPSTLTLLVNACNAASCLQDFSCSITAFAGVYWNVAVPGIGDVAYGSDTGCSLALPNDGYYVIDYSGTYTVVEIINHIIVSFPSC